MDTAAIDKLGADPDPAHARCHQCALPDRKALIAYLGTLNRNTRGSFFFNSGSTQDPGDSNSVIAEISAGGLGLPDRDYYLKTDAKSEETRKAYLAYVEKILTLAGEPAAQAQKDAASIMRIETDLAKASFTRVERRDPYKQYHKMTVAQLSTDSPVINWPDYLRAQGVTERHHAQCRSACLPEGRRSCSDDRAARRPQGLPSLPRGDGRRHFALDSF